MYNNNNKEVIIEIFNNKIAKENLSVVVTDEEVTEKDYSFSAGQYFTLKIEYTYYQVLYVF